MIQLLRDRVLGGKVNGKINRSATFLPPRKVEVQKRKLRYVVLMPCMRSGGAERTMLTIAQYTVTCQCVGFVCWSSAYEDELLAEAKQLAPVELCNNQTEAQQKLHEVVIAQQADLIFCWGATQLSRISGPRGMPFVDISQGEMVMGVEEHHSATHFVGVSQAAVKAFPKDVQDRAVIITNGIDPKRISKRAENVDLRKKYGIPFDAKVVLYASRWSPEKRPDTLPGIMERLPKDYVLLVTGHDNPQHPMKEKILSELEFLGERLVSVPPRGNIADVFTMADVMVLPSATEGFPLVVLESFYRNVPVVTCQWPALKEINQYGVVCGSVPVNFRSEEFADEIQDVVGNQQLIRKAKEVCEEHWLASTMAYKYEKLFHQAFLESIEAP